MDIKKSLATLQLLNTRVPEFHITNDFATLPKKEEIDSSLTLGNTAHAIDKINSAYIGVLQLKVKSTIKSKTSDKKIDFSIIVEGAFKFDGNNQDEFEQMLFLNGNSALYSIARSHIINITSLSLSSGQIVLPMLNFVKLYEEIRQGDTEVS